MLFSYFSVKSVWSSGPGKDLAWTSGYYFFCAVYCEGEFHVYMAALVTGSRSCCKMLVQETDL